MLGPITCAVLKRGSSTVNVSASRMAVMAASRETTNHASMTGTHTTGPRRRNAARTSW